jgi:3-oxoadipate enol-lactonase
MSTIQHIDVGDTRLAYQEAGSGDETVVLSHSFLVDHRQFAAQVDALKSRYRVLAFDHRGHGQSDKPEHGYELEQLYRDALGFIEATDAGPCHFVGLSTGGFVGLRLALRRPDLLRSLVVMDAAANAEALHKRAKYEAMFAFVQNAGLAPLMGTIMKIMFGPTFLNDPARKDEVARWRARMQDNDVPALIRFGRGIFSRDDVVDRLGRITTPTLVMVGEHDEPQPIPRAQQMVDGIPGAKLAIIPEAGHLSSIENPDFVSEALTSFFTGGRLPTRSGEPDNRRSPRSVLYDGAVYGRVVEPMLTGVHGFIVDNLPEGERVLEACCGTGGLAARIAATGRAVTGVDLSPRNIAFAKSRHPDIEFLCGDAAQLPFDDDSFDCATVAMALHEMPHACRAPVLRELERVARQLLVVDFAAPMPMNAAGLRNRAVEFAAGRDHFGAFRDYQRRGGLPPLLASAGLRAESSRPLDSGTLTVTVARA